MSFIRCLTKWMACKSSRIFPISRDTVDTLSTPKVRECRSEVVGTAFTLAPHAGEGSGRPRNSAVNVMVLSSQLQYSNPSYASMLPVPPHTVSCRGTLPLFMCPFAPPSWSKQQTLRDTAVVNVPLPRRRCAQGSRKRSCSGVAETTSSSPHCDCKSLDACSRSDRQLCSRASWQRVPRKPMLVDTPQQHAPPKTVPNLSRVSTAIATDSAALVRAGSSFLEQPTNYTVLQHLDLAAHPCWTCQCG